MTGVLRSLTLKLFKMILRADLMGILYSHDQRNMKLWYELHPLHLSYEEQLINTIQTK